MTSRSTMTLLSAGLALICSSCCENQEIERGFNRRCDNLRKTTGWLIEAEQRRPANLAYTASVIQQQNEHDMQKAFVENPATASEWFNEEFRRWQERAPLYLEETAKELSGDLDSLERTVPMIIN